MSASPTRVLTRASRPQASPPLTSASFRPDIEGLRAIAVVLVVLFHAGLPVITGGYVGVDVFFVLSGFLITGMLVDEVGRSGRISISGFYARRVRRLLPLSALVVVATAIGAVFLVPTLTQLDVGADLRSASLYYANWHFASGLTNYMAVGVAKSPALHYWSLAVEEQFYLVWPAVIMGLVWLSRLVVRVRGGRPLSRRSLIRWVGVAIALIFAVSLAWSVLSSRNSGPWAYYGLHTRGWELAAGGGLAVARPRLPMLARPVREVLAWAGLVLVVLSAIVYDKGTLFPGIAAAMPVGGTVALVAAGAGSPQVSAPRMIANPVFRYLGRISYAWYLWHWPCLVLLDALPGTVPEPSRLRVSLAIALSFALSAASHRLVEDPVRRNRWLAAFRARSLVLGAGLTVASLCAGLALQAYANNAEAAARSAAGLTMTVAQARDDKITGLAGCHVGFGATSAAPPSSCAFGDRHGSKTIVLIGDSHAEHWFPGLNALAKKKGWRLYEWSKDSCAVNNAPEYLDIYSRPYPECASWRASLLDRLASIPHIDHLIVARSWKYVGYTMSGGSRLSGSAAVERAWRAGEASIIPALHKLSPDVVLLRDSPKSPRIVPVCLSAHPTDPGACAFARAGHTLLDNLLYNAEKQAVGHTAGVRFVDPTDLFCGSGSTCPAVRDGLIIYRDDSHMTQAYSRSIAAKLESAFGLGS